MGHTYTGALVSLIRSDRDSESAFVSTENWVLRTKFQVRYVKRSEVDVTCFVKMTDSCWRPFDAISLESAFNYWPSWFRLQTDVQLRYIYIMTWFATKKFFRCLQNMNLNTNFCSTMRAILYYIHRQAPNIWSILLSFILWIFIHGEEYRHVHALGCEKAQRGGLTVGKTMKLDGKIAIGQGLKKTHESDCLTLTVQG